MLRDPRDRDKYVISINNYSIWNLSLPWEMVSLWATWSAALSLYRYLLSVQLITTDVDDDHSRPEGAQVPNGPHCKPRRASFAAIGHAIGHESTPSSAPSADLAAWYTNCAQKTQEE
jgi:hypothetical protein